MRGPARIDTVAGRHIRRRRRKREIYRSCPEFRYFLISVSLQFRAISKFCDFEEFYGLQDDFTIFYPF
jgi:hypothetical protein